MYYVVLKNDLLSLFNKRTNNPTENEIKNQIESSSLIYLLNSFDDAKKVADAMFSPARPPKSSGQYGLIAQVAIRSEEDLKFEPTDLSTVCNSRGSNSRVMGYSSISIPTAHIHVSKVSSILNTHISDQAKAYNSNLVDIDYENNVSRCQLL